VGGHCLEDTWGILLQGQIGVSMLKLSIPAEPQTLALLNLLSLAIISYKTGLVLYWMEAG
jgi:hypothetical protein